MKRLILTASLFASAVACANVEVEGCVIRESIPGSDSTVAYFTLNYDKNADAKTYRLPGHEMLQRIEIEGLSRHVEIHTVKTVDGNLKMFQVPVIMVTKPKIELKPGAEHVMVMNLKQPVKVGQSYPIRLLFAYNPDLICDAEVKSVSDIQAMFNTPTMQHKGH